MFRASSSHVWSPAGLPATLLAMPGAIRMHHQRGRPSRRHRAPQRVVGRDELPGYGSRTGMPLTSRVVAGLKICPAKIGPPERVDADLIARQQRAEVAVLERVDGRRVAEARQHAGAQPRVVDSW